MPNSQSYNIIYIGLKDPGTKSTWSGLNYYISQTSKGISDHFSILFGFRAKHTLSVKIRNKISRWLGYNFYYDLTNEFSKQYAAQIREKLPNDPAQVIVTVNSQLLSYLEVPNKMVLYNDATFANLYGYYGYFSHLTPWDKRQCFRNERRAFQRANLLLFASEWAAQSAISDFGADPAKVHVVPFGANLANLPEKDEVHELIDIRRLAPIRLLWVGVDFGRKGGTIAVEVARLLNETGTPATLTIAGIPHLTEMGFPAFVKDGGVFDKDTPAGEEGLKDLYRHADFFILPSLLECYGVVFAEASAFGLPLLAIRTGGVPTIVQQGFNGWLFEPAAPAQQYADAISNLVNQPGQYQIMARQARQVFDEKLNWQVAGEKIRSLISALKT